MEYRPDPVTGPKPVGTITIRPWDRAGRGTTVAGRELMQSGIDEIPLFAELATGADGPTVIADAADPHDKDTDRIAGLVASLGGFDVTAEPRQNGLIAHPSRVVDRLVRDGCSALAVDRPPPAQGGAERVRHRRTDLTDDAASELDEVGGASAALMIYRGWSQKTTAGVSTTDADLGSAEFQPVRRINPVSRVSHNPGLRAADDGSAGVLACTVAPGKFTDPDWPNRPSRPSLTGRRSRLAGWPPRTRWPT